MAIYLCRVGHKHHNQDNAANCGYCKRNDRARQMKVTKSSSQSLEKWFSIILGKKQKRGDN